MDKVYSSIAKALAMKASFKTIDGRELVRGLSQMAASIRVNGLKKKDRAWECTLGKTANNTWGIFMMIKSMVSELKHM